MKTKWIIAVMSAALLLVACIPPTATPGAPAQTPAVGPTPPPSTLPTQPPSPLPGVTPGGGLITRPEAEAWKNAPVAALHARADLVDRLQVDPDAIKLISAEPVDWSDGCLGIQTPGVLCTMVITPGYRVVLEAGGKQYEYHTSVSGETVHLATATP